MQKGSDGVDAVTVWPSAAALCASGTRLAPTEAERRPLCASGTRLAPTALYQQRDPGSAFVSSLISARVL